MADDAALDRAARRVAFSARSVLFTSPLVLVVDVPYDGSRLGAAVWMWVIAVSLFRILVLDLPLPAQRLVRIAVGITLASAVIATAAETRATESALVLSTGIGAASGPWLALHVARDLAQTATLLVLAASFGIVSRWLGAERSVARWRTSMGLIGFAFVPAMLLTVLLVMGARAGFVSLRPTAWVTVLSAIVVVIVLHLLYALARTAGDVEAARVPADTALLDPAALEAEALEADARERRHRREERDPRDLDPP